MFSTQLIGQRDAARAPRFKPVSFAILEDYDKGADLAEIEADFRLFGELGIRTWRGSFGWDDYEPERGRFDFAWLHRFAAAAARHQLTLRPYLGYTPAWAARPDGADADAWNNPPERIADWRRFAGEVARALRRHPNVASFEIYNEENVAQWWDGSAGEYARTLVEGSRAIRAGNPRARVVFGGLVFPDVEWIEEICRAPGARTAFTVLPVHAYPETWTPAGVTAENYLGGLDAFVAAADAACGMKSIWINETGYATVGGRTEAEQAAWWIRATASFLASPRVEHIGVYEIRDLPLNAAVIGDAPNYHLGLARVDRTPKLAFRTVDMLTDLLDVGRLAVDDAGASVEVASGAAVDLHHHLFVRPDGERVLIIWDREGSPAVRVTVRDAVRRVTEYAPDGRPTERSAAFAAPLLLSPGQPRVFRLRR